MNQPPKPARRDGWTPERRETFLDALTRGADVRCAAARAGMAREGAYRLRRRDPGFAREWSVAQRAVRIADADAFIAMLPDALRRGMDRLAAAEQECDLRPRGFYPLDSGSSGPPV